MTKPHITTRGEGRASLEAYFTLLHDTPPHNLPEDVSYWVTATYDAPYGFLYTWPGGAWCATFKLNALAAHISTLLDVHVVQSSDE